MSEPITIFCPFTRHWAVDKWLENLANVEHDPALTNLCIIVDGDQQLIANKIKKFAESRNYRSFYYKVNEHWHPNEVRLGIRRARVAEIHNQSKDLIIKTDGKIIIGFEDDTMFDRLKSFDRLIQPLGDIIDGEVIGFVEGVQMGRWGANMIGAWLADNINNPKTIETMLPSENKDYQEITGGGWYGYATYREPYLNCEYYTSTAEPWGPDVNYGFWLRRNGYRCLIDWQTVFGHRDYNKVAYPDDEKQKLAKIVFTKDFQTGRWERTDHERSRY